MAMDYQALRKKANDIRIDIIRSVYSAGSGHRRVSVRCGYSDGAVFQGNEYRS